MTDSERGRGRRRMPLTTDDLDVLAQIYGLVQAQDLTLEQTAKLLGVERTWLYRLMDRVNDRLGDPDLSWKIGTLEGLPPPVRRLAARSAGVLAEIQELGHFPRISAGSAMELLLREVLRETPGGGAGVGWAPTVRGAQVPDALRRDEIDLALVHDLRPTPFEGVVEAAWTVTERATRRGGAPVDVSPRPAPALGTRVLFRYEILIARSAGDGPWAPLRFPADSTGARLAALAREADPSLASEGVGLPAGSFLAALEAVRRARGRHGLWVALPDWMLKSPGRSDLLLVGTGRFGAVSAVFRESDAEHPRLGPLLDQERWQRAAGEGCG